TLQNSEDKYRKLYDHMNSGVVVYEVINGGEDFIFKDINPAGEKFSNVKREEILGRSVSEVFPGFKDLSLFDIFKKVWKTGVPEYFPTSLSKDDKVSHWIENHAYKLPTGGIVAVYNDQTEKKTAEQKLLESEEMFRSIFMNSPIGIELYDYEGKLLDVNRACLDMFGVLNVNSVKGFDLFQDPNVSEDVKMELQAGRSVRYETEFDFEKVKYLNLYETTKSGVIYIDVLITPLYLSDTNSVSNYIVQVQDITERKRVEELLEIQNRISQIFLTVTDDKMYPEVLDIVLEILNSRYGVFGYIDEQNNCVCPSMTRDIWDRCQMEDKTIVFPRETWSGIWGKSLIEKRAVYSNLPLNVPEGHVKIDNALSVPIVFQDKSIGHFNIANKIEGFNQNDIELLTAIANWTAPILHARLHRDIQEKKRKKIEEDLKKLNKELEHRIEKRTKTLEESETRLKLAQKMAHVGNWEYNIRNNKIQWSDELYRIHDFDQNIQITFGMLGERIHKDDREKHDKNTENWIENGEGEVYEYRVILNDGSIRYIYGVCDVSLSANGKPIKIFGTLQDITQSKIAEQKLIKSEEEFRMLFENANDAIFLHGFSEDKKPEKFLKVNKMASQMYGYSREELLEMTPYELSDPDVSSEISDIPKKLHLKGDLTFETINRTKDGQKIDVEARSHFFNLKGKNVALTIVRDIGERKIAEKKIYESEEKYRRIIDSIGDSIEVVDRDLRITLMNPAYKQWLKSLNLKTNLIGKTILDAFPFLSEKVLNEYRHVFETGEVLITEESITKTSHWKVITETRKIPIIKEGKVIQIITVIRDITKRKLAEKKIVESESRLRNLMEAVPIGISISNPEGLILDTNSETIKMFGYDSKEEFLKRRAIDFYHDQREREKFIKLLEENGYVKNFEFQAKRKDGSLFWLAISSVAQTIEGEIKFINSFQDINESKMAEIKIADLAKFPSENPNPVLRINKENVIYSNRVGRMLFNINEVDVIPKILQEAVNNIIESNITKELEIELNGRIYSLIISPIEKAGYANIYGRDITERKKAEEDLLVKNYALYSSINAIAIANLEADLTYVNPSFLEMWGYSNEKEVLGIHVTSFWVSEEEANQVILQLRNKHNWSGELIGKKKDGVLFDVLLSASLVMDKNDNPICIMITFIDITQRKRVEQLIIEENRKLKELSEMKRDFITRVSHELKTPLTSIHGASYYLLNYHKDDLIEEVLEYLKIIHRGGLRLKSLVEDLVDISRLEAGKLELKKTEVNIAEIIKECLKDVNYFASHRNLMLKVDIPDEVFIEVDKIRMGQVISNILSNAIKNTPSYGEISVLLKEDVDIVSIKIKDTGVGITQEEKPMLFKKFGKIERYGKGMDVDTEGTGLGLFISKEIVELHFGDILLESKGRNQGAIFTVMLPKTPR
ncbi:MAG: PAS domain S-box protein, partial [Promethearchaeota archaeon]